MFSSNQCFVKSTCLASPSAATLNEHRDSLDVDDAEEDQRSRELKLTRDIPDS